MRGPLLSRQTWWPRASRAAVALCAPSRFTRGTLGGGVTKTASCATVAACAVCRQLRFYSAAHPTQRTTDDSNSSSSSNPANSPDPTSDDAMDLIWSAMPNPHEEHPGGPLTSSPQEHKAATSTPAPNSARPEHGGASDADATETSSPAPKPSYVWVTLHNMPRNWLHEDIVEMIHQIADHAGIAEPQAPHAFHSASGREATAAGGEDGKDDTDEGASSALSRMSSPFVRRLHIPFGRRTGIVYGSPKLLLTSPQLADYLIHELTFDPDDFRNRVYFTRSKTEEVPRSYQKPQQLHGERGVDHEAATDNGVAQVVYTPIEETVEREQDEALRTLELDRYLFAPDLLLDIAKAHQRRLVTKREKVLLDAFVDGEEDSEENEEEEEDGEGGNSAIGGDRDADDSAESRTASATRHRQRRPRFTSSGGSTKRKRSHPRRNVRAGTQKHLGRGSMHNMPIPKPYVEGRNL
ncbi:hypothetical protein JKF63_06705 [Porcisia hertigi]|uniref:Uncharacterized protein n=1 Tax=Porcisia hertigi TaxID=2761500 RepID=A0A836IYQ3_9TRYP|nr:hypothetical protein JKF63_06705 [Porcisia hertigi]